MAALVIVAAVSAAIEVGSIIYRILNRPKLRPPVGDAQIATSIEGAPITFGYGTALVGGELDWSPGLRFVQAGIPGAGGSNFGGPQQFLYFANFRFDFAEGPGEILKMWGDTKIIYDGAPTIAEFPPGDFPAWNNATNYNIGDIISYQGEVYRCEQENVNIFPGQAAIDTGGILYWSVLGSYPPFDVENTYSPGDVVTYNGQLYVNIQSTNPPAHTPTNDHYWRILSQYYPTPTLYPGTQDQDPDAEIQANEGAENTPAFRGLIGAVFKNFPLANFGNRIPSVRALIKFGAVPKAALVDLPTGVLGYTSNLEPPGFEPSVIAASPRTGSVFSFGRYRAPGQGGFEGPEGNPPTMTDDAFPPNAWTELYSDATNKGFFWLTKGSYRNFDNVTYTYNGNGFGYNFTGYVIEVDHPDGTTIEFSTSKGTTSPASGSIGGYDVKIPIAFPDYWVLTLVLFRMPGGQNAILAMCLSDTGFFLHADTIPDGFAEVYPGINSSWSEVLGSLTTAGTGTGTDALLPDVVRDVCVRAGIEDDAIDVSLLTAENVHPDNIVRGYAITRPTAAAEIIKVLFESYFFDACESDGKLKFVPRGLPPALTIPEDDLGLLEDQAKIKPEQISQEQDLPFRVEVTYNDIAMDYQQGKQEKRRSNRVVHTRQVKTIEFPLTLDTNFARQIAEKELFLEWLERFLYATNLWRASYLLLDPTDVISFVYEGRTITIRIVEKTDGQGWVVALNGVSEDARNYLSSALGGSNGGFVPPPVPIEAPTILFLFDIPLLRDIDSNPGNTGYLEAMSSAILTWPGAALLRSSDDANFPEQIDQSTIAVAFGYATTVLGKPRSPWTWDRFNSLTVKMTVGTLTSDTELNVLNGSNALLVGNFVDGFEVIQYVRSTLNADGTLTLSQLTRSRRGSDYVKAGHAVGDLVLAPITGARHEKDPLSITNLLRYYRAVTAGSDVSGADTVDFTNTGNELRPYAVAQLGAYIDTPGNIVITWLRRTRVGGQWKDFSGRVPVSEDAELYDVEILDDLDNVVRTIAGVTTPTAVYTVAHQMQDFHARQSTIKVNVYQLSAQIGRGFVATEIVPRVWPPPVPAVFPAPGNSGGHAIGFYVNGA